MIQFQLLYQMSVQFLYQIREMRRKTILAIFRSKRQSTILTKALILLLKKKKSERNARRFWVRPGRSKSWWQNFTDYNAVPEEWKENLRMNRANIYNLCDMLRPYLTKQVTNLRLPLTVEEQVGTTLYFLADKGRFRKVANAFGVSRATVSRTIRTVRAW